MAHTSGWVWFREDDEIHRREDNARFRAVLGHCPKCIAVLDENGCLAGYNEEFRSLLSTSPIIGAPVGELFDERARAMLEKVVASAGTRGRAGAIIAMRPTAGEEREVEFLVATLPGDGTQSIGVVMAGDDRTARVQEEGDRAIVARGILDANCHGAINMAQSAVCHDMNNVLSVMTLAVGVLKRRCGTDDPEISATLRELEEAARHGAGIVARARDQSQVVVATRDTADVRECVERAAQVVAPLARRAKVTLALRVSCDAQVPLGGTALTQALTNLLSNSIHAIEEARRPGRIEVTVDRPTPQTVTLSVRDDGMGIEPSRLVDSFEAFQTTRAALGGTGLGLAIARTIIEGAGGRIDVVSTVGSGTEMRLELPAADPADRAIEATG